jgi:hypothetical protein
MNGSFLIVEISYSTMKDFLLILLSLVTTTKY